MRKFNRVLSTWLFATTALVSLPYLLSPVATAQTNARQQSSWWQIFQNDPPVEEKPGSPRGLFCGIAPRSINTNTEVWSDRPLFVWQGNLGKIGVRLHGERQIFWSQTVDTPDKRVTYAGDALQPGQTYDWVILNQQNQPLLFVPFKVMDAPDRDRIRVRLAILDRQLQEKGATPEEIAMQRANFFAQQQLWSDVLKEVYSVENPSAALEEIIQQIPPKLCSLQRG